MSPKNGTQRSVFWFKSNKFGTFGICVLWIFFTSPDPKYQRLYPPRGSVPEAFSISSQTQSNLLAQFGTFLHRFLSHVTHAGPARLAPCGKPVWALVLLAMNPCEDQLGSPRSEAIWVKRNLTRIHLGGDGFSSVSLVNQGYLRLGFDTLTDSTNSKAWNMRWARETSVTSGNSGRMNFTHSTGHQVETDDNSTILTRTRAAEGFGNGSGRSWKA